MHVARHTAVARLQCVHKALLSCGSPSLYEKDENFCQKKGDDYY